MGANKVILGAKTIIDITDSTVTAETLEAGVTAYGADGEKITGTGELVNVRLVGNPKPEAAAEGTIWIDTDAEITGWAFQTDAPDSPAEGMVWIATSDNATVPVNTVKNSQIIVYPIAAYQYLSGAWVQKAAQTYSDGAWQEWHTYLFREGQVNNAVTGGINGTIQDGVIYFHASVAVSNNKTYTTINKIDLTNVSKMKCVFVSPNTVSGIYFRLLVPNARKNGENVTTSYLVAYKGTTSPFAGWRYEVTLDVSGLSGEYYVGYAWGVSSDASSKRDITGSIEEWWLE